MNIVLAFDPGETTGYAVADLDTIQDNCPKIISWGEFPNWKQVDSLIRTVVPRLIIYEKFILYPGKAKALSFNEMIPAQVVGVIRFLAEKENIAIVGQTAREGKGHKIPEDLFKKVDAHMRDAMSHIKYYAMREGLVHP